MSAPLQAIVRFELASRAVNAATAAISDALSKCAVSSVMPGDNSWRIRDPQGNHRTHLWKALNTLERNEHGYLQRLDEAERREWLEDAGCPHCLRALDLIEQRKAVRKELGIAKRALRAIGRAELRKAGEP
jgi:hypothetical protein